MRSIPLKDPVIPILTNEAAMFFTILGKYDNVADDEVYIIFLTIVAKYVDVMYSSFNGYRKGEG